MCKLTCFAIVILFSSVAFGDTLFQTPETCKDGDVIVFRTDHYICETPLVANEEIIVSPGSCASTITTQQPLYTPPQLVRVNPFSPPGLPKQPTTLQTKTSTLGKVVAFDRLGDTTVFQRKQLFLKGQ